MRRSGIDGTLYYGCFGMAGDTNVGLENLGPGGPDVGTTYTVNFTVYDTKLNASSGCFTVEVAPLP